MNIKSNLLAVTALCLGLFTANAGEKVTGGPKGGRILDKTEPKAEFFVEKDKTISITFYDAAMKAIPVGEQVVTVIAEAKAGKMKLEFEKKGDVLVSKSKVPEGNGYNLVVQFKSKTDAKPQNYRFALNMEICGKCKRAEYACICDE